MPAWIRTAAIVGMEAVAVDVEASVSPGLPSFAIVGLPDTAVQEARERIRAAIKASGFSFPPTRVTVNLAPADLKKEGSGFDLPIALALLIATDQVAPPAHSPLVLGELGLDGSIRGVAGVLPAVRAAEHQHAPLVVPSANALEAGLLAGEVEVVAASSTRALVDHWRGVHVLPRVSETPIDVALNRPLIDLADIAGQETAKRALIVAAAGGHALRLIGPPGSGKTLLARAFADLLPPLDRDAILDVTALYSVAGLLTVERPICTRPPFRAPHHTASPASMIGGGTRLKPGEISLAHHGVLFLDEFPEFPRTVLEALRQPLEEGIVHVARVAARASFPARFILVAAQNPCPCGYAGDPQLLCQCLPSDRERYDRRLSGPVRDRIDIHITVPRIPVRTVHAEAKGGMTTAEASERILAARQRASARFDGAPKTNAQLPWRSLRTTVQLEGAAEEFLLQAVEQLTLSARAYHRLLRVARTIADLDDQAGVTSEHVAEALRYREPTPSAPAGGTGG